MKRISVIFDDETFQDVRRLAVKGGVSFAEQNRQLVDGASRRCDRGRRMLSELKVGALYDYVRIARPLEIPSGTPYLWHIIITEPQREATTAERLRGVDIEAYAPVTIKQGQLRTRLETRDPRGSLSKLYVRKLPVGFENWAGLRDTRGVHDFLSIDGHKAILPLAAIHSIKMKEAGIEAKRQARIEIGAGSQFEVGQDVWVTVGQFEKLFAKVEAIDPRGRVEVLLQAVLLGRRHCAVDLAHLRAI